MRRRFSGAALAPLFALLASVTCNDGPTQPKVRVGSLVLRDVLDLDVGRTGRLTAVVTDPEGEPLPASVLAWSSSDEAVATVDGDGTITGRAQGRLWVRASAGGHLDSAGVYVWRPAARMEVTPDESPLFTGQTVRLAFATVDSLGVSQARHAAIWTTSDTAVAQVDAVGLVTAGHRAGSATITATAAGVAGVGTVSVLRGVGGVLLSRDTATLMIGAPALELAAVATDSAGLPLPDRPVSWALTPSSGSFVFLTGAPGGVARLLAREPGVARAVATSGQWSDTTEVTVVSGGVGSILVAAAVGRGTTLAPGDTITVQADSRNPSGAPVAGVHVEWSSADPGVVQVSPQGLVRAVGPGSATVLAEAAGVTGRLPFTVRETIASLTLSIDSLSLPPATYGAASVVAVARGASGQPVGAGQDVAWQSSDPAVAHIEGGDPFSLQRVITTGTPGRAVITATSGGRSGTMVVAVTPSAGAHLRFSFVPNAQSPFEMLVRLDSAGSVLMGRTVKLAVSDTALASLSPAELTTASIGGDGFWTGRLTVTPRRSGVLSVSATSGDAQATTVVNLLYVPVATVRLSSAPAALAVGATAQLAVTATGTDGRPRSYPVRWSVSDPAVASVSDAGVLTALEGGSVWVRASIDGLRDSARVLARAPGAPVVAAVSPAVLRPGDAATITGENLAPSSGGVPTVSLDGVPLAVLSATPAELRVVLPEAARFACAPTHAAALEVSTGPRLLAGAAATLAVATGQASLARGRSMSLRDGGGTRCNELTVAAGAAYLISVSALGATTSETATLRVRGTGQPGAEAAASAAALAALVELQQQRAARPAPFSSGRLAMAGGGGGGGSPAPSLDSLRRAAEAHDRVLEGNRRELRRLGQPVPLLRARRAARARAAGASAAAASGAVVGAAAVPAVGDLVALRVPRIDMYDYCSYYTAVSARVRYVGPRLVIYEDVKNPLAGGAPAGGYDGFGRQFEASGWPVVEQYFGNVLAMDRELDGDGRIAVLFTRLVNDYGPAGFVTACDFFPAEVAPASNEREILYAMVPETAGTGYQGFTWDNWVRVIRSTIVHESKHLTMYAERISRGAGPEESWLEEGSAMISEEIWARGIYGNRWRERPTYRSTLYCDIRPSFPECASRPYVLFDHFAYLYDYLRSTEGRSPLGYTGSGGSSFYGSAWSLLRWAADQYAGSSESDFFKQLTTGGAAGASGAANLAARSGRSFPNLVGDWSVAVVLDVNFRAEVTPEARELTLPSWSPGQMFAGMAGDIPSAFPSTAPTSLRSLPYAAYSSEGLRLRGGTTAHFYLQTSDAGRELLELDGAGAGVTVVRVR